MSEFLKLKIDILSKSRNIREKINYVLYSKQENQSEGGGGGGGMVRIDLDEKDFDTQRNMSIKLNKSLTQVTKCK